MGQRLVVIEAMKMEQALLAPFDGTVAQVRVSEGDQVSESTLLRSASRENIDGRALL